MFSEPRVGCGAAIVDDDGRLLLIRRRTEPEAGCWGLPGGKIDLFETSPEAARREVKEELGIDIDPVRLLCVVDHIDAAAGIHWVAPVYLIADFRGTPRNVEPDKHDAFDWFALDALPAPLTTPTRFALEALRARTARSIAGPGL